MEKKGFNRK